MRIRLRRLSMLRNRELIVVVTLLSHIMVTCGLPCPMPSRKKPDGGVPYPCQSRPCGCQSSEECWKGDCCCFSLEEKLRWAEAHGIEPPAHVRPLVQSRAKRSKPVPNKTCCSAAPVDKPGSELRCRLQPDCCQPVKSLDFSCCSEKSSSEVSAEPDCPHCAAKAKQNGSGKSPGPQRIQKESGKRWLISIFVQKCRGEGPAGLYLHDTAIVPDIQPLDLPQPEPRPATTPDSDRLTTLSHCPPSPPPRTC